MGDPLSETLNTVEQVLEFKKDSGLNILGVGYTIYPGSAFEPEMMRQAAQTVYQAHRAGLIAVLWIYPRGQSVKDEADAGLAAGMAGLAACLGADFVKLTYPKNITPAKLKDIIAAAGRTGVIFSGGSSLEPKKFLDILTTQIKAGARGSATGRNIHQKPLAEAVRFANAIAAASLFSIPASEAYKIYQKKK